LCEDSGNNVGTLCE